MSLRIVSDTIDAVMEPNELMTLIPVCDPSTADRFG